MPDPRRPRDDPLRRVALALEVVVGPATRALRRAAAHVPRLGHPRRGPAPSRRRRRCRARGGDPAPGARRLHARPPRPGQGPAGGTARPPRRVLRRAVAGARRAPAPLLAARWPSATRSSAGSAPAPAGESQLDAWDAELAAAGIEVMATRAAASERLAGPFADAAASLGLEGEVSASYRPRCAGRRRGGARGGAGRAPLGRPRARLQRLGPAPRRARARGRRALDPPLRLAGPAAPRPARTPVRRAAGAPRRRPPGPADAPRRRHQRARPRSPAPARRAPRRGRRAGADHRDGARPPAGRAPRARSWRCASGRVLGSAAGELAA